MFLKVNKIPTKSLWRIEKVTGFRKFKNNHFQGAHFGGCLYYQLLMVNMIQKGFQNISANIWKRDIHYSLVYFILKCSSWHTLISVFKFSRKSATLHESVKVFISVSIAKVNSKNTRFWLFLCLPFWILTTSCLILVLLFFVEFEQELVWWF